MSFEAAYTAIFDDIETTLKELHPTVKQVIYKTEGKGIIRQFPCVFINPGRFTLDPADAMGIADVGNYALDIRGELVILIREADPDNWFGDIIEVIGEIIDAIFADQTLGGSCLEAYPNSGGPGEVTFQNTLYYGGTIGIRALRGYL